MSVDRGPEQQEASPSVAQSLRAAAASNSPKTVPLTKFNFIKDNRKYLRAKITRLYNSLQVDDLSLDDCEDKLEALGVDSRKLNDYNLEISNQFGEILGSILKCFSYWFYKTWF